MATAASVTHLLFRVGRWTCGLPVGRVVETMRPLPARPLAGAPPFVEGVAVVRGLPTPVIRLAVLLGAGSHEPPPERFVCVRLGERRAALAVDAVLGAIALEMPEGVAPPILGNVASELIQQLEVLDGELLAVLAAARIVPEAVWSALAEDAGR